MKKKRLLGLYTAIFAVACLLLCATNLYYGRSLLYAGADQSGDGLIQHFNSLSYYGEWLRTIVHNLWVEHRLEVPLWDLSIGLGGDVLTTLSYYVLGDPLCLLSFFVPADKTEWLYNFLVLLRLYLAGLAFLGYARHRGCQPSGALLGAIVYAFSFYSTVVAVLHPYYLNPLIYLPLLLWGIDRLLEGKGRAGFVLAVFLAAVSNFYFFYMLTLVMAVYAILACWQKYHAAIPGWHKSLLRNIGQGVACYLLGLGMAAFLFLPSAAAVLSGDRVGGGAAIPLTYEPIYYAKLIIAFVNASADYYSALGFTTIGVLAVGLLFFTPARRYAVLKIAFLLGAAGLCIPFVGHVFNGFGYVVNRWVWAFCFVVAYIVAFMMPRLVRLRFRWLAAAASGVVIFALPTFYFRAQGDGSKIKSAFLVCGVAAVGLALLVLVFWAVCKTTHRERTVVQAGLIFGVVLVNQFLNAFGFYAPCSGNDVINHEMAGTAWQQLHESPASAAAALPDIGAVRFDTVDFGFARVRPNSAMQYNVNGTAFYYSVANPVTAAFLVENEVNVYTDYIYNDLDGRAWLETLLGVRYAVVPSGDIAALPWGYDTLVVDDGTYAVYESQNALPLAYFYDTVYDVTAYDALAMPRKQQTAMQALAVDLKQLAETGVSLPQKQVQWQDSTSPCTLTAEEGITLDGGTITVTDPNAVLHLHTELVENCERYLVWNNLWFQGDDFTSITVSDGSRTLGTMVASTNAARYAGIHNIAVNLGSQTSARDYVIRFGKPGVYTVDSLEIQNQPMESLEPLAAARKKVPVNYAMQGNTVTLQVQNPTAGMVYLAIPFCSGWSAQMDGEPVTLLKGNGFGMAVALPAGSHVVELQYATPGLSVGVTITAACWILFFLILAVRRKRI